MTGAAFADTSGDPASFVVPGNASPAFDGAPLYGSPESRGRRWLRPADEPAHDREGPGPGQGVVQRRRRLAVLPGPHGRRRDGWMRGSSLLPRDSAAPKVWEVDDGLGVFSPNGDGDAGRAGRSTLGLSEPASWTLRIRDGNGNVKAHTSGDRRHGRDRPGRRPRAPWTTGRYRWELEATDGWDNGPLEADGTVKVDTQAPALSLADADAADVPSFAPNGDGYRETVSFSGTANEPGSLRREGDRRRRRPRRQLLDRAQRRRRDPRLGRQDERRLRRGRPLHDQRPGEGPGRQPQRGPDPHRRPLRGARLRHRPRAPCSSRRTATGWPSRRRSRCASCRRRRSTWTVVDRNNDVVRTLVADQPMDAGTHAMAWDGRTDGGAFVPRGTYRSRVSVTDGTQTAVQRVAVVADAFRWVVSDATPGRGQKVTVTIVSPSRCSGTRGSRSTSRASAAGPSRRRSCRPRRTGSRSGSSRARAAPSGSRPTAATSTARASPRACTCRSTDRRGPGGDRAGRAGHGRIRSGPHLTVATAPDPSRPHLTRAYRSQPGPSTHGPDSAARARVTVPGGAPARRVRTRRQGPAPAVRRCAGISCSRGCRAPIPTPRTPAPHARHRGAGCRDGRRHPPCPGSRRSPRPSRSNRPRSSIRPPPRRGRASARPMPTRRGSTTRTTRSRSRPASGSPSASSRAPMTTGRSAAPRPSPCRRAARPVGRWRSSPTRAAARPMRRRPEPRPRANDG